MEVISFLVNLFSLAVMSWACVYIADKKGLNKTLAGVMGVLFGCFALCVYLSLNSKVVKEENNEKEILND